MEPLEIKVHTITPITQTPYKRKFPLHLDALLISILTRNRKQLYPLDTEHFDDPYSPEKGALPIAVAGKEKPIYCASAAYGVVVGTDIYTYVRKPPEIEVWGLTKHQEYRFNGEPTGKKKAVLEEMETFTLQTVCFQCIGKKAEIREILQGLNNIGVKRSVGFGEVCGIEVNPINNKYAGLVTYEKMPARALPIEDWPAQKDWFQLQMTYKAPYWDANHITMCWSPDPDKTLPRMG